jgi:hypothetical protein
MAAALSNPQMIQRWEEDPDLLRSYGFAPTDFDLNALWKFAGLVIKIRHNGLRSHLPWTFRLLNVMGLEADLFAYYGSYLARKGISLSDSAEGRAKSLGAFVEHWRKSNEEGHSLIWDVLRHELALMHLSEMFVASPKTTIRTFKKRRPSATCIPTVSGSIVLHVMQHDPRSVIEMLHHASPQLQMLHAERVHLCYWKPPEASHINVFQLDELGFYILSCVDGIGSVSDLSYQLTRSRRISSGLLRALTEIAGLGILTLKIKQSTTRR